MKQQCAILDDYQNVALQLADWSRIADALDVEVFNDPIPPGKLAATLRPFAIVVLMRERTLFSREVFQALPDLRLVVTSGMRNAAIDLEAAAARNVTVCGT